MGLVMAWLAGEGIITYRWIKNGAPPTPGALLAASGFFALCALLHEIPQARMVATLLAVGIDVAALMQVLGKDPQQDTGWPPLMIDNPAVLLPAGGTNGQIASQGPVNLSGNAPTGGSSGGFMTWLGELAKGGI